MITFDHLRLVRRDPKELARFRRWVLAGQVGNVEQVIVEHEDNGSCCRKEPWNDTARSIIETLAPTVMQVLINLNNPAEV